MIKAEQVSHHPPIAAFECSNRNFKVWGQIEFQTKFTGTQLNINVTKPTFVELGEKVFKITYPTIVVTNMLTAPTLTLSDVARVT